MQRMENARVARLIALEVLAKGTKTQSPPSALRTMNEASFSDLTS